MIKLKRLLFDLRQPKQWNICLVISRWFWKIKDYDRIEYDYGCVLDNATMSKMSKTNYELNTIYAVINDTQQEFYYGIIKSDILELIEKGATIDEIKDYANGL